MPSETKLYRGARSAADDEGVLYFVGVDGGGTGTRARIVDRAGHILGEASAGSSGLTQGIERAWDNIQHAIGLAALAAQQPGMPEMCANNLALGMGLAGINHAQLRKAFLDRNPGYRRVYLETDAYTALLGAHGGRPGAIVAAGTGSIGAAFQADGSFRQVGGWGFPSGDDGSGAYLGLRAANIAQRFADGRFLYSALAMQVRKQVGTTDAALLEWCCAAGQGAFATLAPLVFECEAQDPLAAQLLAEAVASLEEMVLAVDPTQQLPLVITGSIGRRLASRLPAPIQQRLVAPQGDAIAGAIQLCLR